MGSTVARFGEPNLGPARLADGTLLGDAVRADPRAWLGRDDGAPGDTGVLVKLLDAGQRLPVHVHPTREYASRHLGCAYGKTEAWYVLEADDGAAVWVGWRERVDQYRLAELVEAQDADAMLALMHRIPVRPGDGVLVPGGTPHAIGAGVLLVEVRSPPTSRFCWSALTPRPPTTKFSSASPGTWHCRRSRRLRSRMSLR